MLLSLFVGGNCLLVGVPGLAKTLLIATLAEVLDLKFNRIQFTPDLMPSDITGTDIIQEDADRPARDRVRARPDLRQHRARRRDQPHAAQDAGGAARGDAGAPRHRPGAAPTSCAEPFFVLATQNPIEQEGTYPLPEAQLDRFMFHIVIEHPPEDEEFDVVRATTAIIDPHYQPAGERRRSGRVPAPGAPRAGRRPGAALRAAPRPHQPAEVAAGAGAR